MSTLRSGSSIKLQKKDTRREDGPREAGVEVYRRKPELDAFADVACSDSELYRFAAATNKQ
jgi:hypothetical protein